MLIKFSKFLIVFFLFNLIFVKNVGILFLIFFFLVCFLSVYKIKIGLMFDLWFGVKIIVFLGILLYFLIINLIL